MLQRPLAVLTNLDLAARLNLPPPPTHGTWPAFLLVCAEAQRVIAAAPPGTSVFTDPAFSDSLASLRPRTLQGVGKETILGAFASGVKAINACTSCWRRLP